MPSPSMPSARACAALHSLQRQHLTAQESFRHVSTTTYGPVASAYIALSGPENIGAD